MNIAVVGAYTYPLDFALAERDLRVFRAYSATLGTVAVVAQSPDSVSHHWEDDRVVVQYVPRIGPGLIGLGTFWLCGVVTTWRLVRRYRLAVADASDLAAAFVLIPIKWLTGIRLLLHLQFQFFEMSTLAFPRWKRWAFRVGATVACRYADSIRCVTEDIKRQALRVGVEPGKLVVIPTRCDPTLFDPAGVPGRPAGTARRLVYVGSLTRLKGLDVLLDAMTYILTRFPDARLQLVGGGPLRDALERQAARLGLVGAIEFAGSMPYSAIPETLASADVFIFPSHSEAMPRAVLEAMAMERPVVASRVGGIAEAVRDGVDGLLVSPGYPHALALATCRILSDPDLAQTLGRNGRRRILERFAFQDNVQALVAWHRAWGPGA